LSLLALAEQGNAEAQFLLGTSEVFYAWGSGGDPKTIFVEQVYWIRKAAEQGHAGAQCQLGERYHLGQGVPKDDAEAEKWLRKAAEHDYTNAQVDLGTMYSHRRSPQDHVEAINWYRKAAEQGNKHGQYFLGLMYESGQGVPQDFVLAHMWYNLAAGQGDLESKERRQSLTEKMTPSQIAEAQRLAREWKPEGKE